MKITITTLKPRNPLVAPTRLRQAGRHQPTGGAHRQSVARQLRRELQQFELHKHSP